MRLTPYKRGTKARANSAISRPGVQSIYSQSTSFSVVTLFTLSLLEHLVPIGHTQVLIRRGWKKSSSDNSANYQHWRPASYTRVMLAWVHNKKSSSKPVMRNSSNVGFYVAKRACLPHKIVPRARNYDLNRARTTLTAKHKTWDLSISCRQNSSCEKMYPYWPQNVAEYESLTFLRDRRTHPGRYYSLAPCYSQG